MRPKLLLTIGAAIAAVLAGVLYAAPNFKIADKATMRAYRVSILSDGALRQLHESAQRSVKQRRDESIEFFRQALAEREARVADCEAHVNDAAYRARNPGGCESRYLGSAEQAYQASMRGHRVRTADEEFEALIMAPCEAVHFVGEAQSKGCLPP